jgi:co-chaperonin GroES (HSP10)
VRFKNEIWWHETSYWKVDIQKIFCTVHGDAKSFSGLKYSMLNGYVLCDLITEYKSDLYSDNIIRPESEKMVVRLDRAKVKAIGENNLEVQPGDTIWFSPKIPQVYSLNRKKFIIVSQRHILAVT